IRFRGVLVYKITVSNQHSVISVQCSAIGIGICTSSKWQRSRPILLSIVAARFAVRIPFGQAPETFFIQNLRLVGLALAQDGIDVVVIAWLEAAGAQAADNFLSRELALDHLQQAMRRGRNAESGEGIRLDLRKISDAGHSSTDKSTGWP